MAVLLTGGVFAWLQTLRALELEPRAVQSARQTAGLVSLARAALKQTDGINRVTLLKGLSAQEATRVTPREPADQWESFETDRYTRLVSQQLRSVLGPDAVVARSVNGAPGLWVGFSIDRDRYWLQADATHASPLNQSTWMIWTGIALAATLVASVAIASLINRPLRQLSFAASRIREGDLDSRLDENTLTSEIREVNMGFNRMARELAKVEEDRTVMLAGISHDLRTPLARLRLETELSVADQDARDHMAADINQLDAIIDKFLDYARPDHAELKPVLLNDVIDACLYAVQDQGDMRINLDISEGLYVLADEVELARVISNLIENARRYGKTPETGIAVVDINAKSRNEWVLLKVRDHGMGVAPEALPNLIKPFFRGDAARTAATGAGLGLAIVDKTVQRMGGIFALANTTSGGLAAHIKLQRPKASNKGTEAEPNRASEVVH